MDNYTKKKSNAPGAFNRRSTRRYDPDAPTSVELIKQSESLLLGSPEAWFLSGVLASYYDGVSHTGVISPKPERVMHQLNWDENQFADALTHLIKSRYWSVSLGLDDMEAGFDLADAEPEEIKDTLMAYGVRNIDTYIPRFIGMARENKSRLKRMRVSLNHLKTMLRYAGMEAGLSTSMQVLAVSRMVPVFNDLGYSWFRKQSIEPVHVLMTPAGPRKLCHSVLFDHPMMSASNASQWKHLASIQKLTDEMVARPKSAVLSVAEIAQRFSLSGNVWDQVWSAVHQIKTAGWFTVRVLNNPFGNGMDASLLLTPTKKLHDLVWSYDFQAGGRAQTQWEAEHGFLPASELVEGDDPQSCLPKLGYHWIYLLRRKKTGEYLSVGQTTTSLSIRVFQHRTEGTNSEMNKLIQIINSDPHDGLEISCIGLAHHYVVAEYEMRALWKMNQLGHKMMNKVNRVADNRRTIHLDARLTHMKEAELKEFLILQKKMNGDTIFLRQLPPPPKPLRLNETAPEGGITG